MTCTCCLEMGERAISQSSPSKALRMFCQSRFSLSFLFVCTRWFRKFAVSPPSLHPAWIRSSLCSRHLLGLRWSSVGLVGLVALTSHARCTVAALPSSETLHAFYLCFWFQARHKCKKKTVQMRLSSGLKIFTWFQFSEGSLFRFGVLVFFGV